MIGGKRLPLKYSGLPQKSGYNRSFKAKPSGTFGLFQCAVSLFQTLSLQQKAEDTEA